MAADSSSRMNADTLLSEANDPDVLYLSRKDVNLADKFVEGVYYIDRDKFLMSEIIILSGNEGPVVLIPFTKTPGVPAA